MIQTYCSGTQRKSSSVTPANISARFKCNCVPSYANFQATGSPGPKQHFSIKCFQGNPLTRNRRRTLLAPDISGLRSYSFKAFGRSYLSLVSTPINLRSENTIVSSEGSVPGKLQNGLQPNTNDLRFPCTAPEG